MEVGRWLDRMEWHPARRSVCLPLVMFPCTTKVHRRQFHKLSLTTFIVHTQSYQNLDNGGLFRILGRGHTQRTPVHVSHVSLTVSNVKRLQVQVVQTQQCQRILHNQQTKTGTDHQNMVSLNMPWHWETYSTYRGYWTTRGLPTRRLDDSRTGQLAD